MNKSTFDLSTENGVKWIFIGIFLCSYMPIFIIYVFISSLIKKNKLGYKVKKIKEKDIWLNESEKKSFIKTNDKYNSGVNDGLTGENINKLYDDLKNISTLPIRRWNEVNSLLLKIKMAKYSILVWFITFPLVTKNMGYEIPYAVSHFEFGFNLSYSLSGLASFAFFYLSTKFFSKKEKNIIGLEKPDEVTLENINKY